MAACSRCEAETNLYTDKVPICLRCANEIDERQIQRRRDAVETLRKKIQAEILKQIKPDSKPL